MEGLYRTLRKFHEKRKKLTAADYEHLHALCKRAEEDETLTECTPTAVLQLLGEVLQEEIDHVYGYSEHRHSTKKFSLHRMRSRSELLRTRAPLVRDSQGLPLRPVAYIYPTGSARTGWRTATCDPCVGTWRQIGPTGTVDVADPLEKYNDDDECYVGCVDEETFWDKQYSVDDGSRTKKVCKLFRIVR